MKRREFITGAAAAVTAVVLPQVVEAKARAATRGQHAKVKSGSFLTPADLVCVYIDETYKQLNGAEGQVRLHPKKGRAVGHLDKAGAFLDTAAQRAVSQVDEAGLAKGLRTLRGRTLAVRRLVPVKGKALEGDIRNLRDQLMVLRKQLYAKHRSRYAHNYS